MLQRSLLVSIVMLTIIAINLWHLLAGWLVRTQGPLFGVLLLILILLFAAVLDPPWEDGSDGPP